jgi:hypothetical protein
MIENMLTSLVITSLCCWRVTHLLNAEDGPGDVLVHFRRACGDGFFGKLLDCFYCLSLWIAAPLAYLVRVDWWQGWMAWLSISAGACLLERATLRTSAASYYEVPEEKP